MKTSPSMIERSDAIKKPQSEASKAMSYFPKDVKDFQMAVLLDQGVYRHIKFGKPGSVHGAFELITWPGHLTIAGDMGSYSFARNEDMFSFFRADSSDTSRPVHEQINARYWHEKMISECAHSPAMKTCPLAIADNVKEHLACFLESSELNEEDAAELKDAIDSEILSNLYEGAGEYEINRAMVAINEFDEHGMEFVDFHETTMDRPSMHFTWCLAAIVWGINQYDQSPRVANEANTTSKPKSSSPGM